MRHAHIVDVKTSQIMHQIEKPYVSYLSTEVACVYGFEGKPDGSKAEVRVTFHLRNWHIVEFESGEQ